MGEHEWFVPPNPGVVACFCLICGIVKRRDGKNKPCKGPTKLRRPWKPDPPTDSEGGEG